MTIEEILADLKEKHLDKDAGQGWIDHVCGLFTKWLQRGDGVAVYENKAMDSSNLGHKQFCSFGSPSAQIETSEAPQRMPDIGRPNWAYQLVASYKLS